MRTTNKQATKAKNSNLSAIDILLIIGTAVLTILIIIFAPSVADAILKFVGILAFVAMLVGTCIYALTYNPQCDE